MRPEGTPIVYHIPVCPFSQRLEVLLSLKGRRDAVRFEVIDVTQPRPAWLLQSTGGSTSLPVLQTEAGQIIKESLVILRYLEERFPAPAVAQRDPARHAVEQTLIAVESDFCTSGYRFVMNQDRSRRETCRQELLAQYERIDELLARGSGDPFLFVDFGLAETVFTPLFMRLWLLDYYEDFDLPAGLARVRRWRDACLAHPAAQQVTREQIVKLYYDYAKGVGNGALPPGRSRSSFSFVPHWSRRPWPSRDKYGWSASDAELGLLDSEAA
jgi:glutathione S-transferase